nr:MAG TPA: hypothetical protein [Caudoviricetes sp.]
MSYRLILVSCTLIGYLILRIRILLYSTNTEREFIFLYSQFLDYILIQYFFVRRRTRAGVSVRVALRMRISENGFGSDKVQVLRSQVLCGF